MKSLSDRIDALRFPSFGDQAADAITTLILLLITFALIGGISWVIVKVYEWRESRRGVFGRVR